MAASHLDPFLSAALKDTKSGFSSGIFAFYLTEDFGSELHIGGIDPRCDDKDIEYHDILKLEDGNKKPSYWAIHNAKIRVNGNIIASKISTIIDSGTDIIFGHKDIVSAIYEKIPFADGANHLLPCHLPATQFPSITISWGDNGKEWTIVDHER